jgi:hypothetical protein
MKNYAFVFLPVLSLFLFAAALPSKAYSAVDIDSISYWYKKREYIWDVNSYNDTLSLNLINKENRQKTNVKFSWKNNVRTQDSFFDEMQNVIAPKPGRNLWFPHPTSVQTLEELFLKATHEIGYPKITVEYIQRKNGHIYVSDINDFITKMKKTRVVITPSDFLKSIKQKVTATTADLSSSLINISLNNFPEKLNIIQPIKTPGRYDAFSLFPLQTYLKDREHFLNELTLWANTYPLNPLIMFQTSEAPDMIKLSILALLTHNHLTEENLVKLVILDRGLEQGWKVFKAINSLYANEQSFWDLNNTSRHDIVRNINPDLKLIFYKTNFMPFDKYISTEANLIFTQDICTYNDGDSLSALLEIKVPAAKSYHFYGSIITAYLMRSFKFPLSITKELNKFLVGQYKDHSGSRNSTAVNYLKNLYSQGAHYVYKCM